MEKDETNYNHRQIKTYQSQFPKFFKQSTNFDQILSLPMFLAIWHVVTCTWTISLFTIERMKLQTTCTYAYATEQGWGAQGALAPPKIKNEQSCPPSSS